MLLRCTNAFGNFVPGDEVEVPDDAVFDSAHFERAFVPEVVNPGEFRALTKELEAEER